MRIIFDHGYIIAYSLLPKVSHVQIRLPPSDSRYDGHSQSLGLRRGGRPYHRTDLYPIPYQLVTTDSRTEDAHETDETVGRVFSRQVFT